jgi:putative transposase
VAESQGVALGWRIQAPLGRKKRQRIIRHRKALFGQWPRPIPAQTEPHSPAMGIWTMASAKPLPRRGRIHQRRATPWKFVPLCLFPALKGRTSIKQPPINLPTLPMPQSLSKILIHLVFSTKNRESIIPLVVRPHLHAYIVGILENLKCPSLQTGGTADHVHILFLLARTIPISEIVEEVKKSSSKWMKTQDVPMFAWQAGYGAFSIGESQVETVVQYIKNQEEHHRKLTFQEEYRRFLEKYRVAYDERYVWD